MRQINYIVYLLAVCLLVLSACDRENLDFGNAPDTYGKVSLASMKLSVNVNSTPSSRIATVDASNYIVGIYRADNGTLISEWKYSEMPEIFLLKVGKYKVIAHAPNTDEAIFDEPYCRGEKSFEILKDQVTNIESVQCTLSCIMVDIQYEEAFRNLLGDEVNIKVIVGKESLNFSKDEARSGYFHAASTGNVVDVNFVGTIDGEDNVKITRSYSGIELGSQLTITYSLKDADGDPGTGGSSNIALKVDTRCDVVTLDGSVLPNKEPGIEDFPSDGGGEEPGDDGPIVSGVGFDIKKPQRIPEDLSGDVIVNLAAPGGMQKVEVMIISDNEEFAGLVVGIFESNSFDLAHPASETQKEMLKTLNFPIENEIINQKNVNFDLTEFMAPLSGFTGTHQFRIKITDTNGAMASEALTLIVKAG